MTYTICTVCDIHHYEDCPACFGFGFHGDGVIMSAADACNRNYTGWIRCHECGSTPLGVPVDPLKEISLEEAFKRRVLKECEYDFALDASEGHVFWPEDNRPRGFYTAASLRVIANELDRRNQELFSEAA